MNDKVELFKPFHGLPKNVFSLCLTTKEKKSWINFISDKERLLIDLYIELKL